MSYTASKVIAIAEAEVGYLEKASNSQLDDKTANSGDANYTKYARDLDAISGFYYGAKQGFSWCAVFVDWCFVQAFGVDEAKKLTCHGIYGAGVDQAAIYYKNNGQFHTSNPKVGDEIFFGDTASGVWQHTGLVYKVDSTKVYTIEGNVSHGVFKQEYNLTDSTIFGYGRPNYDEPTLGETTPNYNLYKPSLGDPADITKLNENWDILDSLISFGTEDLVDGTSPLKTGTLYVVYE